MTGLAASAAWTVVALLFLSVPLGALSTRAGALAAEVRQATLGRAAATGGARLGGGELSPALHGYVDKVARHAYRVTDEDIAALRTAGYSDDQLFEVTLSAAVGAAWARLDRGLAALKGSR